MENLSLINVVKNNWPSLAVFTFILIIVRIFCLRNSSKGFVLYQEIILIIFFVYTILLFDIVKSNINIELTNYVPFKSIISNFLTKSTFLNNILNPILIFMPLGYFASSYIKEKSLGEISLISLLISSALYFVIWKVNGFFDIDNVILAVIGMIIGFLLYIGFSAIKKHLPSFFQNDFLYNIFWILLIITVALYFLGVISFGWLK